MADPDVPPTMASLRDSWQEAEQYYKDAIAQLQQRNRHLGLRENEWLTQPTLVSYPTGAPPPGVNVRVYAREGGIDYGIVTGRIPKGSSIPEAFHPGRPTPRRGRGKRPVPPLSVEVKKATGEGDVPIFADTDQLLAFVERTATQALARQRNMPPRTRQYLLIDIRGQDVSSAQRADLVAMLQRVSNGVLIPTRIRFLVEDDMFMTVDGVLYPFAD